MGRWVREFDSWAITDTVCFALFDRTPHAWKKVAEWSGHREEFVKRAAFALLASLAAHDKACGDGPFLEALPMVERASSDERNFVKKGVIWALRSLGRRSLVLNQAAIELAARLAASAQPTERSIGKETLRELKSATVQRQVTKKKATGKSTAPRKAATRRTATKTTATRKGSR
jgi:3-methyladenine DNA glycosylase AlkD